MENQPQIFTLLASLRMELIEIVEGVDDAASGGFGCWDDTTPNDVTKSKLEDVCSRFEQAATDFGVFVARKHYKCGSPSHSIEFVFGYPKDTGREYALEPVAGETIAVGDNRYIWDALIDAQEKHATCPCSAENTERLHRVISQIIYRSGSGADIRRDIGNILFDLSIAIDNCADRRPRSGIREYLLRTILRINDRLLPMPMDRYIQDKMQHP